MTPLEVEVRDDEPVRDAAPRPALHLWLPGSHPSHRTHDASAGNVPGELKPGTVPAGGPQEPPELGGRPDQYSGPRETGGLPVARAQQSSEPPVFVDARSLKIIGRDQRGENWEALVFGRSGVQEPPGGWPQLMAPNATGDTLYRLENAFDDNSHVQTLGRYQAMLDRHYARR
jgi:hypothetical protein